MRTAAKGDLDNRIMTRPDEVVLYGDVTGATEAVRSEGFDKVVVIAEQM